MVALGVFPPLWCVCVLLLTRDFLSQYLWPVQSVCTWSERQQLPGDASDVSVGTEPSDSIGRVTCGAERREAAAVNQAEQIWGGGGGDRRGGCSAAYWVFSRWHAHTSAASSCSRARHRGRGSVFKHRRTLALHLWRLQKRKCRL